MFCRIIGQVVCPRFPQHKDVSLFDVIYDTIEPNVNGAWAELFDSAVCDAYCQLTVRDNGSGLLGVVNLN